MKSLLTSLLVSSLLYSQLSYAAEYRLSPGELQRQPSQEYFSSSVRKGLLIPVDIWGGVVKPGRYYLPLGSNLQDAIGAAGGPARNTGFPSITFTRAGSSEDYNVYKDGRSLKLEKNDTVMVNSSVKQDLPIWLGVLSAVVSIATLGLAVTSYQANN
jgi:hypothetical protein